MNTNIFIRIFDNGIVYEEDQSTHTLRLLSPDGDVLPESEMKKLECRWLKSLQIEITDRCNERCVHCYIPNQTKDTGRTLPKDKVKDLMRQFRNMGGLRLILSGGETLLHPNLIELLQYGRRLDLMLFLHTNLLILTEKQAQELGNLKMFNVQVSLYSDKADVHDAVTGRKGSFAQTIHGLELLVKYHVPVTISCPIMRQNAHTIEGLKAYADKLGVDCYFDDIMMAQHNGDASNLNVRVPIENMRRLVERLIRLRPEYMQAIRESRSEEELLTKKFARRMTACSIMASGMCIDSDGTAYPCAGWNAMKLGNVNTSTLQELWQKGKNVDMLRHTKTVEFPKCSKCNLHNFCDMCPVYNFNENGDMTVPCVAFCQKAQITRETVKKIYQEEHKYL